MYHEKRIPRGAEIDSLGTLAYLSTPLDRTEHIFVLDGLPRTRRDPTFQIKDSIFEELSSSSRTARNPPSNISNASTGRGVFVFCLWSLRYLRETLETPRRGEHWANVFHLALSLPVAPSLSSFCLGLLFFMRKLEFHSWGLRRDGLVILDGRHRFSSWKLMDTLTSAKRKTTPLNFLRSYRTSIFVKAIIRHHRWIALYFSLPLSFFSWLTRFYFIFIFIV